MITAKTWDQRPLSARLNALPPSVREAAKAGVNKSAAEMLAKARAIIPVGDDAPHLRDTIRVEPGPRDSVVVKVGTKELDHVIPLEFGSRRKDGSFVAPQPFWYPLVRIMRKKNRRYVNSSVRAALRKLWSS